MFLAEGRGTESRRKSYRLRDGINEKNDGHFALVRK